MHLKTVLEISILGFAFLINILLAFIVYKNNPRSATNLILSVLCWINAIWLVVVYFPFVPDFSSTSLFWIRLSIFLAVPQTALFFILANVLPYTKISLSFKYLLTIALLSLFVMYLNLSPLTFTGLELRGQSPTPIVGPGMLIFIPTVLFFSLGAVYSLLKRLRSSSGTDKQQLLFVLYGILLMLGLIIFTILIPVVVFKNNFFVPFAPVYSLTFLGMTSYAIIKHRLMEIRLVVARAVSFTLLTVLFAFIYALAFSVPILIFSSKITRGQAVMISTVLAVIMAFSFQPLRRVLEEASDKLFYKGGYDSSKLLSRLGSIMSVNIELRPLTAQIIGALIEQMRVSKGAFIILGEGPHSVYDVIEIGFNPRLNISYDQLSAFLSFSQTVVFDDLEEGALKDLMRKMNIAVVKDLKVKGEAIGLLLMGEKASGEIYSEQDLKILEILAPEAAIAIQNAQSYDKIKKFNVILSQEVKRATLDLQEANNRLKVIDKLKDDFVSIASHELRTPMTAIRSYAWMALHRSDVTLSKNLEKYITRILISTERLINLVNDMLNVSRIESGRVEINPEPIDLLILIKDIIDEVYFSKSEEKRVEFVVLEKSVPKVFADPEKLRQVFLNLVGNSLKFTPAGGKITFDFFSDGHTVETSVTDTGVGIPKEDIGKLFHKFSRLDNSYTAAATSGGTGLGLYISRNLVELMHGKIRASSEGLGKGTTITITLPAASADVLKEAAKYTVKPEGEVKGLEPAAI